MEIFIAIVIIAGGVFFGLRRKKSLRDQTRIPRPLVPNGYPFRDGEPAQSSGFNKNSAEHLEEVQFLSGPAYVVDGDTITIKKTQIRLFGIDAPELNHPFGQKAKWALVKLCKGQKVQAEITEMDEYGRTVAYCRLPDGRDLSAEMVKLGLAIDWPKFSGGMYQQYEVPEVRKKLFLADARQKGRMHIWDKYEQR
ncbi:MAG: thermonuclease family protein [Sulfitobacter sp.]